MVELNAVRVQCAKLSSGKACLCQEYRKARALEVAKQQDIMESGVAAEEASSAEALAAAQARHEAGLESIRARAVAAEQAQEAATVQSTRLDTITHLRTELAAQGVSSADALAAAQAKHEAVEKKAVVAEGMARAAENRVKIELARQAKLRASTAQIQSEYEAKERELSRKVSILQAELVSQRQLAAEIERENVEAALTAYSQSYRRKLGRMCKLLIGFVLVLALYSTVAPVCAVDAHGCRDRLTVVLSTGAVAEATPAATGTIASSGEEAWADDIELISAAAATTKTGLSGSDEVAHIDTEVMTAATPNVSSIVDPRGDIAEARPEIGERSTASAWSATASAGTLWDQSLQPLAFVGHVLM